MSKKDNPVDVPEGLNEEEEESDEYEDIEEEEEEAGDYQGDGGEEDEDEDDHHEGDGNPVTEGSNLTALLLAGGENDDDDDDETDSDSDDEEFTEDPLLSKPQNGQVETTGPSQLSAPPLQTSVSGGTKRPREEGEEEEASDYGESEETGQVVNKKARAAAEEEV